MVVLGAVFVAILLGVGASVLAVAVSWTLNRVRPVVPLQMFELRSQSGEVLAQLQLSTQPSQGEIEKAIAIIQQVSVNSRTVEPVRERVHFDNVVSPPTARAEIVDVIRQLAAIQARVFAFISLGRSSSIRSQLQLNRTDGEILFSDWLTVITGVSRGSR